MNVVFEEQAPVGHASLSPKGLVGWMLRNNITQTASQAQTVLLVIAVIVLAISVLIGKSALSQDEINTHKNFVPAVIR